MTTTLACPLPVSKRTFVCDYPYIDPIMKMERFFKRRYKLDPPAPDGRTKTFAIFHRDSDGTMYRGISGSRWKCLLYNLPAVTRAAYVGGTIWWTEGEKDADSLIKLGIPATTHWQGAGRATVAQAEWLTNASQVVLLYDVDKDDAHGGNAGAKDVLRRYEILRAYGLPRDRISVGHAAVGKDVTDHLEAGLGLDELVWLTSLWEIRRKAEQTTRSTFSACGYSRRG